MARGRSPRRARHAQRPDHWTHVLAGLPWITIVLLTALVLGGIDLLRPDRYAADATLSAPTSRAAADAHVLLTRGDLVPRVEDAVELAEDRRGEVRVSVVDDDDPLSVVLEASAADPRLAALAADTAAALVLQDRPDVGYDLVEAATVPTDPVRTRTLTWAWFGLLALAAALYVEGAHRVWLGTHPTAVAEGAR